MRAYREEMRALLGPVQDIQREMLDNYVDAELADLEARVTRLERQMNGAKRKKRAAPKKRTR